MGLLFTMIDLTKTEPYLMAKRVERLLSRSREGEVFRIVLDVVEVKKLVRQLNTVKQLRTEHVDAFGDALFSKRHRSGVYSKTTEIISKGRKIAGTPYTLFDTGDFFKSWTVNVVKGAIIIDANPIKEGTPFGGTNLFEEYGQLLGLTDDSLRVFVGAVKGRFIDYVRDVIFNRV